MPRSQPQSRSTRTYQMDAVHAVHYPGLAAPLTPDLPRMAEQAARPRLSRFYATVAALDLGLRLPATPRALALYTLVIGIVCTALMLHVMLSAQIMQAEVRIHSLQSELDTINRQNDEILWQIARATNLTRIQERALALGYVPVRRRYVEMPARPSLAVATTGVQATAAAPDAGALVQTTSAQPWVVSAVVAWWQSVKPSFDFGWATQPVTQPAAASAVDASAAAVDATPSWQAWWDHLLEQGAAKAQQWLPK
jgi:hypothetical protein